MNVEAKKASGVWIGVDVGSTTVKVVALDGDDLLFTRYVRHEGRQAEELLAALTELHDELGPASEQARVAITGSGGSALAQALGARFVQEVVAVSHAAEKLHPEASSVIELGGQDSKIILFENGDGSSCRRKFASMNDKCAGGTGAVIDRIAAKLGLTAEQLHRQRYDGVSLHPVAGKCGVFAETDITGLQKQGVPPGELIASLFDAIVIQNLTVLTRGRRILPRVLLLGGPHVFLPGLCEAWTHHLLSMWRTRNILDAEPCTPSKLVFVPGNAQYFGAIGAVEFGRSAIDNLRGDYVGLSAFEKHVRSGASGKGAEGCPGLASSGMPMPEFLERYRQPSQARPSLPPGELPVFLGIDGGSTSTKAAVLSTDGELLGSAYRLSRNDPIADAVAVLQELRDGFLHRGVQLKILGAATTGYSRTILQRIFNADLALVETIAHANSALRVNPGVDAIIDVGGQDIKIILLQDGAIRDFRLNMQCSAGNGYFLQATAESLGIGIEQFAARALQATRMPVYSYGCAVFLQADVVNFQRQGWGPDELIAGLAAVLPKNVFLYVAGVSNIARLGKRFLLQGATQRNLAVVKAEVDFIRDHYFAEGEPEIYLHPHCGEAGAIGAALEARRRYTDGNQASFVPLERLESIRYTTRRDESTRCSFCSNRCARTFLEYSSPTAADGAERSHRVIIASCERGEAESIDGAKQVTSSWKAVREANPCIPSIAAQRAWDVPDVPVIARRNSHFWKRKTHPPDRAAIRIGIPRALNMFACAPFLTAYLRGLGVRGENIVFSHGTNPAAFREAVGFAAIDPCFPSKVCVSHVVDLLRKGNRLSCIFFPMVDAVVNRIEPCVGCSACPAGTATPEAVKAALSATHGLFEESAWTYLNPLLTFSDPPLLRLQLFECWQELLGLSWDENALAVSQALEAQQGFDSEMRRLSREILLKLEKEGRIGLVLLGRPYHHDAGINQGIIDAVQKMGFPVLSQSYLPDDEDILDRLFGLEVKAGAIMSPFDISDVWKNSNSANTNQKLWAAKFTARHPNLLPLELSNFKCGHDAFVSQVIEQIFACAGKPCFSFRDLDENKPLASIRLRLETMQFMLDKTRAVPA